MIRTIVSLEPDVNEWLNRLSRKKKVSKSSLIRLALKKLRKSCSRNRWKRSLLATAGAWCKNGTREDAQIFLDRLRSEWDRVP